MTLRRPFPTRTSLAANRDCSRHPSFIHIMSHPLAEPEIVRRIYKISVGNFVATACNRTVHVSSPTSGLLLRTCNDTRPCLLVRPHLAAVLNLRRTTTKPEIAGRLDKRVFVFRDCGWCCPGVGVGNGRRHAVGRQNMCSSAGVS
jgi:hypothetical protein